jgi:hypothetical protein
LVSARLAALALALLSWEPALGAPPDSAVEREVKAEFIERFAEFVDWPKQAFASDTAAFQVCMERDCPMRPQLQRILAGGRIKGRPARLRVLKPDESPAQCHILYIAQSAGDRLDSILTSLSKAPVLTIEDSPGLSARGVLINLFVERGRVRFFVNADSAEAKGLSVSSRLRMLSRREGG